MPKVAIVYGTRYGSTREIAEQIGIFLKKEKIGIEVLNLREVKKKKWPSVDDFDGVIVGTGIRIGLWTKEPREFLKKNKDKFEEKYLGVFVSCGTALKSKEEAIEKYIRDYLKRFEIEPDLAEAFGPVFDLRKDSGLGFLTKKIIRASAEDMAKEYGLKLKLKRRNDFRNWDDMKKFADKFTKLIRE